MNALMRHNRAEAELNAYLGYVSPRNQPTPPKPAGSVLPEKLNRFSKDDMAKAWVRGYKAGTEDTDAYHMGRPMPNEPNPYDKGGN